MNYIKIFLSIVGISSITLMFACTNIINLSAEQEFVSKDVNNEGELAKRVEVSNTETSTNTFSDEFDSSKILTVSNYTSNIIDYDTIINLHKKENQKILICPNESFELGIGPSTELVFEDFYLGQVCLDGGYSAFFTDRDDWNQFNKDIINEKLSLDDLKSENNIY